MEAFGFAGVLSPQFKTKGINLNDKTLIDFKVKCANLNVCHYPFNGKKNTNSNQWDDNFHVTSVILSAVLNLLVLYGL